MVQPDSAVQVAYLHREMLGYQHRCGECLVRTGELLNRQKASMKGKDFEKWVKAKLPFDMAIAGHYLRFYEHGQPLKALSSADALEGYVLLDEAAAFDMARRAVGRWAEMAQAIIGDPNATENELRQVIARTETLKSLFGQGKDA